MKKFFTICAMTAIILIQVTPAFAREIYAGSEYAIEFYADTDTLDYYNSGKFTVMVNEYTLSGVLTRSTQWKFYSKYSNSGVLTWYFDNYSGERIPVNSYQIAIKVFEACRGRDTRISSR